MLMCRITSKDQRRHRHLVICCVAVLTLCLVSPLVRAEEVNRVSHIDSKDVWYPKTGFPKLITPQWVGEPGVECVVTLAIDDMRDTARYEAFLRPILQRLKQIDGRAPVSIMSCQVSPEDPLLQQWLTEGLSLECHTADHPCPILSAGSLPKAKSTYDRCVDLLSSVPNNRPVAFRTPCCDSLNTVSPRLFSEIIAKTTASGNFLQLDSSVFTVYTADDPSIPRSLLMDPDGREKFRKYIPRKLARGNLVHDGFVNLIENYPYPYVIQNTCWEFPCMVPSDWSANHLQQPNNPDTLRDWKIALDITVHKQGVFNMVFHPHGWIKAEQVIEFIDHAVARHGKKVKFLTFRECVDRLNQNVLDGDSLRTASGADSQLRLIDLNSDGYVDCVKPGSHVRYWVPEQNAWQRRGALPIPSIEANAPNRSPLIWGSLDRSGGVSLFDLNNPATTPLDFNKHGSSLSAQGCHWERPSKSRNDRLVTGSLRDIDGDGHCELLGVTTSDGKSSSHVWTDPASRGHAWRLTAWQFPPGVEFGDGQGNDAGLRLVDLNEDGLLDLVFSNHLQCGAWLFERQKGWTIELLNLRRSEGKLEQELAPIVAADGSDNGFFVRDRQLCWINENTDGLADFVMRVPFDKLLGDRLPEAKSPEAARQSMHLSAGYRIDLVACEPLTMDPVAMDWGADGKLWIAEMADYPRGIDDQGRPGGRVRYLEDINGDGICDKSTLFLENVPFPSGVLAWKKGVLISAAPDVLYAEDTDGDGKADIRKVVFTGFAEGNQQHRVNGFTRGLDNWLYLANGDSGGTIRLVEPLDPAAAAEGKFGTDARDIRSRDLRIRPDTGEIEVIAGQSQFGRNRDDWGNWFGNNNSRPLWHYLLDDHYLRRNSFLVAPALQKDVSVTPGNAPVFPTSRTLVRFNDFHTADRFTSACSSMIYRDNLIGRDLPGNPMHCFISEPVHNLVHRELMRPDGLSFTSQRAPAEQQSEFLSSSDNWFRPTQLKTGPDGALYIADMYRLVIEHPQWIPIEWQRRLDLRAGYDKGRIWRVSPVDSQRSASPRLDRFSTSDLVRTLRHANGWQRDLAQQLLLDRADPGAVPLLKGAAISQGESPDDHLVSALGRLHALCTLDGMIQNPSLREASQAALAVVIPVALQDSHPGVRRHAVRLCESIPDPVDELWQRMAALIDDPDPQVRLQLAYSLGEFESEQAARLLGQLARTGPGQAAGGPANPQFLTAVLSSLNSKNLAPVIEEAITQGEGQSEILQQLLSQATAFNHESALVALLTRATNPSNDGTYARWQYVAVEQFLISLERRFATLDHWLKERSPEAQPIGRPLQKLFAEARRLALSDSASIEDRGAAIRVLGRNANSTEEFDALRELISPRHPPALQSAAVATLARSRSKETAGLLLSNYRSMAAALRTQTCEVLLSREAWRDELLSALEEMRLLPSDLDAATRQRLLDHRSKDVAGRAAKVLASDLNSDRAKLVADYLPAVRNGTDVQLGSQLFKKLCATCHKLGDVGHAVGPDLVSLTDKSPDALLTAILDPNRAVETRFLTFTATTREGVVHTGILAAETAGSLTLRAAEGKEVTLLRSEIEELQSGSKSLMPDGLERDLKPADAQALIAFIRSNVPLPAMKTFPGNVPRVVTAGESDRFKLTPEDAEIYGPTIVIEDKHRNLGWWSSADDEVIWTIDVRRPGRYSVHWTYACEPSSAGSRIQVEAAGKSFAHRVEQTTGWDDYQTRPLGEVDLPAGQVRITVKPAARPLPALADVQSIVLSPKE